MSDDDRDPEERISRRALLAATVGAGVASVLGDPAARADGPRMPVVYLPHGGGPWPFVELGFPRSELDALADHTRSIAQVPPVRPRALLVISAHWEERVPTVTTAARPPLVYDYYGFPPEAYAITWPAPGDPALAARVRELLGDAGIESATHATRGFDHGTFVPLKVAYPAADVPTIQLSLQRGLDPAAHLAIGHALAPLRDEGVFLVGSGMSYHNLRRMGAAGASDAARFDAWLRETVESDPRTRDERLMRWASAPAAREAHPREEHLLPLMVVAGAAGADRGRSTFGASFLGCRISGFRLG